MKCARWRSNSAPITLRGLGMSIATLSSTLPGRVVSTTTRSARYTASSMWWVTKTTIFPEPRQMSSRNDCIWNRVCTSRAANGSSIMIFARTTGRATLG
jgi:hypothetical protein